MTWSKKTNFLPENKYLTTYALAAYFKVNSGQKQKKFQKMLAQLHKENILFVDENENIFPLVEQHHSQGRYGTFFRVQNVPSALVLLERILKERGLDVYPTREGVNILQIQERLGPQYSKLRIKKKLVDFYRFQSQFVDENNEVQDLVFLNSSHGEFMLHPSEKAFQVFKEKIEKTLQIPVISPARVAVKLGLHKGFGSTLEKQFKKLYQFHPVYFDENGNEKPLIHRYVISNKEHFYLSSDEYAFEMFKEIHQESREKSLLSTGLEKLKKEHPVLFYAELRAAYQEGVTFINDAGKKRYLVEKRASLLKGTHLVLSPDANADKVFKERLNNRIKEHTLAKKAFGITALASKMKMSVGDTYSLKEVLKMLYEADISYLDSNNIVRPLVVKRNEKYLLMSDKNALKIFQYHMKAFVESYSSKPKNYQSFNTVASQVEGNITKKLFYAILDEMQKEGLLVSTDDGMVSFAVQRFKSKNKVQPFLHKSPQAIKLFQEILSSRER